MCSMMPPITTSRAVADGVDVDLDRVLEELVDQHRAVGRRRERASACSARGRAARRRSPWRGRRARRTAAPAPGSRCGWRSRSPRLASGRCRSSGRRSSSLVSTSSKRSRSSARSIESGLVPMIGTPAAASGTASLSGVWPPNCTITPYGLLAVHDREHVLERQRLEVEPVGRVVVGRDRLRVAVDHDRLEAVVLEREGGVHAAVVELDALPDAVRAAAEDHDLLAAA